MLCLFAAGVLAVTLPVERFTLAWTHSVEKIEWREDWRVADNGALVLERSWLKGTGAGMEPGPDAVSKDGWWVTPGHGLTVPFLNLAASDFTADYRLCWDGECQGLREVVPEGVVRMAGCP